jgi:thiosulfate/3-mercaptopyruvate sulfurtransferase
MNFHSRRFAFIVLMGSAFAITAIAEAQTSSAGSLPANSPVASAEQVPAAHLIQPADLAALLQSSESPKPLVLQIGFRVLYVQAHIPGSEYVAAGSSPNGIQQLHERVQKVPRNKSIVLYCGCCPWNHCPNVQPAYQELQSMGFTNVKVLYIAHDFGTDWVSHGYPVEKGQ